LKWLKKLILTEKTKILIKEDWKPCGLDESVEQQLEELYRDEMRVGHKWIPELLEYSVKKATNQAKGLAEKYGKDVCYYLTMALKNR